LFISMSNETSVFITFPFDIMYFFKILILVLNFTIS
jgi:hypothetical protein